jgi:hypothetical protein
MPKSIILKSSLVEFKGSMSLNLGERRVTGTISEFIVKQVKTKKTCVCVAGHSVFRMHTGL